MEQAVNFPSKNTKKAIFLAWLLVGTLDITSASINYMIGGGKTPVNVFVYISSGIFGADAFQMDRTSMAILGLALHYFIAFCWTFIFFTIYPRLPFLSKNRLLTGIGYGIFIWTMMSQIVVKLSSTPKGPFSLSGAVINAGILCVAIGIPLSYIAHRHYYGRK
ncbi:MAG TPA: hypothetical protein VK508_05015 [Cyclobacteriaceae bacterium]|nr:hypothetical protein [Cyclobacteriaceae bacterium]